MTEPKAIKDMTAAEYGELALAERRGETLEWYYGKADLWSPIEGKLHRCAGCACVRIKPPEPVLGSVTMWGSGINGYWVVGVECARDTHTLTIPTEDGEIVTGTFRDEQGREIVVGRTGE